MQDHISIFTKTYELCEWGNNDASEYSGSSGGGSSYLYNKDTYIPFVKKFIVDNNITKVIDLGCGDFICGPHIYDDLNISYTGYDAYEKVILHHNKKYSNSKYKFVFLDFLNKKEEIECGDVCILKDVLQHWNTPEIYAFLDYVVVNKKFKFILITNCKTQSENDRIITTGMGGGLISTMFPLKKYSAKTVYEYGGSKEVSLITIA
jgi:hypothetical protein